MTLICPICRVPLPLGAGELQAGVARCGSCGAEVDVSRAGTAAGRPRFVAEVDRTGQLVGGYRLTGRIGAGGMGTVYRAERAGAGGAAAAGAGAVAVKFLTPALAGEPEVVARFAREARLLRTLEHPGIVRMIDHGASDGVPWFAMELVDGRDLKSRLATGTLTAAEVERVFPPLFEALDHAHGHGVVHRDIKPANVLLAGDSAKLADFGIALPALHGEAAMTRLTETAAVIGTLPYMSPEQRAGGPVDRRSDLFSMGVMLYEAVTGHLPVGAFPPASRVNRSFTAALDRVVERLLQPEPEARFLTAAEAARALRPALRDRRRVVRRLVGAGAGAALALAVGLGVPAISRLLGARDAAAKDEQQQRLPSPAVIVDPAPARQAGVPLPLEPSPPPADNAQVRAIKSKTVKLTKSGKKAKAMPPAENFKGTKGDLPAFDDLLKK